MKRTCSPLRLANIKKLRGMKLTYRQIGEIFGVSSTQIQYWLNGRSIKHFRRKPKGCEICGRAGLLNHHHWDNPRAGIWLRPRCHWAADVLEGVPGFALIYHELKATVDSLAASGTVGVGASV